MFIAVKNGKQTNFRKNSQLVRNVSVWLLHLVHHALVRPFPVAAIVIQRSHSQHFINLFLNHLTQPMVSSSFLLFCKISYFFLTVLNHNRFQTIEWERDDAEGSNAFNSRCFDSQTREKQHRWWIRFSLIISRLSFLFSCKDYEMQNSTN